MKDCLALDAQLVGECSVEKSASISPFVISPYISGTFVGFEEEFKHLHSKIFPKLDNLCREKGLRYAPVDHRRTAIETRSSADFILTHALNSIRQCAPFFMAIFGQQYGPHKSPKEPPLSGKADFGRQTWSTLSSLDRNSLTAGKHGHWWVLEKKWQYCSWLELEIQMAALEETSSVKQCFFYVRDFKQSYLKQSAYDARNNDEKENFSAMSGDGLSLFEAESEYAEKKLNDLKMRIVKKGWPIKFFTSPMELGTAILENWTTVINLLFPTLHIQNEFSNGVRCNETSRLNHEAKYHFNEDLRNLLHLLDKHTANSKPYNLTENQHMIGQGDEAFNQAPQYGFGIFSTLRSHSDPVFAQQKQNLKLEKSIFALVGDPGSGKSSAIATWLRNYEAIHPETLIISEFIGSSYFSRDIGSFIRRCIKIIREMSGKSMTCSELAEDTKDYSSLISAFHVSISRVPCVLVLDSLNDLKASMGEDIGSIKRLTWLPAVIPSNCKIIMTTRRSDLTYKAITARKDVSIKWIPILPKEDRIRLLKNRLEHQLLSVGPTNAEKLTGNRLSEKPLFLVTLAGLISSCTSQREVDRVVEKCTELRTFRDFWKTTFSLWTLRYSWKKKSSGKPGSCHTISAGWIVDSLRLIAVSRNGLFVSEILHILFLLGYRGKSIVTPYDWMIFQKAAKDTFSIHPEGYITLSHTEIRHAVKFFLLGIPLPSATASAASFGGVNMQQHYHTLLSNYFTNYGSLQRKVIELPWQLQQGCDLVMLCQVLSKPRFFESVCQAAKAHPTLNIDLLHYWKKLNDAGFNPSHYLQTMVERASEKTKGVFFLESQYDVQSWRSGKLGLSSLKTMSTISSSSMRKPSVIMSTAHDDQYHRRQSTIGSRSEAGDYDLMSEVGSYSFFVTENDPTSETYGWSPKEVNPESAIDETSMDDDECSQLSYEVCMFLQRLGGDFIQDCKDGLLALSQLMLEVRPLSSLQQLVHAKTLCSLANLSGEDEDDDFIRCLCEEALEIIDSLSVDIFAADLPLQESMMETKTLACRLLADVCVKYQDFKKAEALLKQAMKCQKFYYSATDESNIKFSFAKLYVAQGLYGRAETNLKQVFMERLRWYGPSHIAVGHVLHEMADLYSILESQGLSDQRISLLAYKQAFHIYQQNSDKNNEANLLHKIGSLLKKESSLFSTQEARQCLENAMDLYTIRIGPTHTDIPVIREDVRKLSVNLSKGQYEFGHAKPVDKRTDECAFSTMTWHEHDLKKMTKRRNIRSAPPSLGEARSRSTMQAWKIGSTAYDDVRSVATHDGEARSRSTMHGWKIGSTTYDDVRSVATHDGEARSRSTMHGWKIGSTAHDDVRSVATHDALVSVKDDEQNTVKFDMTAQSDRVDLYESDQDEARDTIIIPAGRDSRLSVKLRVAEGSEKSFSIRSPVFKGIFGKPLLEEQSEIYSEYSDVTFPKRSIPRIRHHAHRKNCRPASGPNGLCLTVHGSYSAVESILDPPPSPRINVRRSAILHKSAWYNVPGRYMLPGKILPPKHGQVRSEGPPPSSRRSCRSFNSV